MAGSGGGGAYPRGGAGFESGPIEKDKCNITFDVDVFGPVPTIAALIKIGSKLDISLARQSSNVSIAILFSGKQLGSIAGSNYLPTLVDCLQNGVIYEAEVLAINGSKITIRVTKQ